MEDYKFLFKVVLVGNAGVGKTCLVRRFTQGMFPPGQGATIGVDFMIKTVEIDGEKIKVFFLKTRLIICVYSGQNCKIQDPVLKKRLKNVDLHFNNAADLHYRNADFFHYRKTDLH
jgi:GTPase SAR1 family protein